MNRQHFAVIYNPQAGQDGDQFVQECISYLVRHGAKITIEACWTAKHATEQARIYGRSGAFDGIIACGGDGTIRAIAAGVAGRDMPIGIIPSGTANLLAAEIGLKHHPRQIADVLINGASRPLYSGKANGHIFMLMCGIGFDASVVYETNNEIKRRFGRWAFACSGLKHLFDYRANRLYLQFDDEQVQTNWIVATKASHYAGRYLIDKNSSVFSPELTAVSYQANGRFAMFKRLLSLGLGAVHNDGDIDHFKFRKATVSAAKPALVQLDGDLLGTTPVVLEYGPVIHFLTPARQP